MGGLLPPALFFASAIALMLSGCAANSSGRSAARSGKLVIVADENNLYMNLGDALVGGLGMSWRDTWRTGHAWANYTYLSAWDEYHDRPLVVAFRTVYPPRTAPRPASRSERATAASTLFRSSSTVAAPPMSTSRPGSATRGT